MNFGDQLKIPYVFSSYINEIKIHFLIFLIYLYYAIGFKFMNFYLNVYELGTNKFIEMRGFFNHIITRRKLEVDYTTIYLFSTTDLY